EEQRVDDLRRRRRHGTRFERAVVHVVAHALADRLRVGVRQLGPADENFVRDRPHRAELAVLAGEQRARLRHLEPLADVAVLADALPHLGGGTVHVDLHHDGVIGGVRRLHRRRCRRLRERGSGESGGGNEGGKSVSHGPPFYSLRAHPAVRLRIFCSVSFTCGLSGASVEAVRASRTASSSRPSAAYIHARLLAAIQLRGAFFRIAAYSCSAAWRRPPVSRICASASRSGGAKSSGWRSRARSAHQMPSSTRFCRSSTFARASMTRAESGSIRLAASTAAIASAVLPVITSTWD